MTFRTASALILSLFFSLSCQSSSEHAQGPEVTHPFSVQDAAKFKNTAQSIGEAFNLASQLQAEKRHQKTPSFPGDGSKLNKLVGDNDAECKKTIVMPEDQPPLKAGDNFSLPIFSMEISGPNCPVHYVVKVGGTQLPDGIDAQLTFTYEAMNDAARTTNDVDKLNFGAHFVAHVTSNADKSSTIVFNGTFSGGGHSQTENDFTSHDVIDVKMTIGGGTPDPNGGIGFNMAVDMNETDRFIFKDFDATLTSKMKMSNAGQTAEYAINGKSVTEAEYKTYHDSLKLPGMDHGDQNGGGNGGGGSGGQIPQKTMACEISRFDAAQVPLTVAQQWASRLQTPTVAPLRKSVGCNATYTDMEQIGPTMLMYNYQFTPDFARLTISASPKLPGAPIVRMFLLDEEKAFADSLGAFTILSRCKPVAECPMP